MQLDLYISQASNVDTLNKDIECGLQCRTMWLVFHQLEKKNLYKSVSLFCDI